MIIIIFRTIYVALGALFAFFLFKDVTKRSVEKEHCNPYAASAIGFVSNFFDALGIGSFAISTVLLKVFKQVPVRLIPGTLNVMCILPTFTEAFIYIGIIQTDFPTLICMVSAAWVGGWLGAGYVAKLPERKIQLGMSIALFLAASNMFLHQMNWMPVLHGDTLGLRGFSLIIATLASVVIGALVTIGIGTFAPILSLAFLLGMSAKSTFPIMMTVAVACSYASSFTFMRHNAYSKKVTAYMAVFGMLGVLAAAFIVKSLPLHTLTWLVMGIIYYASISLFVAYMKHHKRD